MSVATRGTASNYLQRAPSPSGLADVIDLILDKGLVIDAYIRIAVIGIELITIDARIVIASVDTYLRFAEAVNRLDLTQTEAAGLAELRLVQVEPVDLLGEAEIGVDARDHDPGVDREHLDADHRHPYVGVDDEALVEDQVEDVREAARTGTPLQVVAARSACGDGHFVSPFTFAVAMSDGRRSPRGFRSAALRTASRHTP
jgi:hypothetical protein